MLVNSSAGDGPTSAATLEAKEDFASKAEAHKTPRKKQGIVRLYAVGATGVSLSETVGGTYS
jgi:hypothetical protein